MIDNNSEKNTLISLIVEAELVMFMKVPTDDKPSCREAPDNFKNASLGTVFLPGLKTACAHT